MERRHETGDAEKAIESKEPGEDPGLPTQL